MSSGWQKAYMELASYVAGNPKIYISGNSIDIPADFRHTFHQLFYKVRATFLEENYISLLGEAKTLSQSYIDVEYEVIKLLNVDNILIPVKLNRFLHDPFNSLMRALYDLLFDLLKGKINVEIFTQESCRYVESLFSNLYRLGYEAWVVLSLIKMLSPDKAFKVILPEINIDEGGPDDIERLREEPVPDPKESKLLSFENAPMDSGFTVPDFIVHSHKTDGYIAFRTVLFDALWTAKSISEKREWYPLTSLKKALGPIFRWPDLLIYSDHKPRNLSLVADSRRICRPDLIVECVEKDWFGTEELERVELYHSVLKPRLGTYVITKEPVPKEVLAKLSLWKAAQRASDEPATEKDQQFALQQESTPPEYGHKEKWGELHILTVNLNQSRLAPIINVLMNPKEMD